MSEGAERILRIATPLFAAKGYSGVSINDIAAAVGGSKANIFHHFSNKKTLYLAAIRAACEGFRSDQNELPDERDATLNRVGVIAGQHLRRMLADPDSVRLILREVFVGEGGIERSLVAEILHHNFIRQVDEIKAEQEQGRVRRDADAAMVAVTIVALNSFFFQAWSILEQFEEFEPFDSPQECAIATFDAITRGLLAR
jgi:TetR/AcrR family transcriptional regulator